MLHEGVFVNMKLERINYEKDIPKAFTPEKYMEVFVTIWKAVRHEMHARLSGNSKSLEGAEWKARFEEVYKQVHADFEVFRRDTYEFVTGRKGDAKEIKKIMQKSYINFASNPDHIVWTKQINTVATEHGKAINNIGQFKVYPEGIEIDPRAKVEVKEETKAEEVPVKAMEELNLEGKST
jgi:hypothetical protein